MTRYTAIIALSLTLALAFACDSDDGGGGGGGASPEAAAEGSADSAQQMGVLKQDKGSEEGLGAAMKLYSDLQVLSATSQAGGDTTGDGGGDGQLPAGYDGMAMPLSADCLQTDDQGNATYTDCQVAGATFNGTITGQGDQITLDITIDIADPGAQQGVQTPVKSIQVTEKGTLTITDAIIDGTIDIGIDMELDLSGQPGADQMPAGFPSTISQTIQAVFDVQLTDGCASAGTIQVTSNGGMAGAGQQSMTATFNDCGDVVVQ